MFQRPSKKEFRLPVRVGVGGVKSVYAIVETMRWDLSLFRLSCFESRKDKRRTRILCVRTTPSRPRPKVASRDFRRSCILQINYHIFPRRGILKVYSPRMIWLTLKPEFPSLTESRARQPCDRYGGESILHRI